MNSHIYYHCTAFRVARSGRRFSCQKPWNHYGQNHIDANGVKWQEKPYKYRPEDEGREYCKDPACTQAWMRHTHDIKKGKDAN